MATANDVLQPVTIRGWRRGFSNLLDHERHQLWGTRRWLVQMLVWIALLNGMLAFVGITISMSKDQLSAADAADFAPEGMYAIFMQLFFQTAAICTAVGAVIVAQGAIIQERQMGTAAWILSKPASRTAFVMAKLVAYILALLVLAMVVPTIVFYGEIYLWSGRVPPPAGMLPALGILFVSVLFYLTLTIMLGTFFNTRGAVLGITLGSMFAGSLIPSFLPKVAAFFPWTLGQIALALAPGSSSSPPLPATAFVPVAATLLWSLLFIVLAIWRFSREEF
jgi:ABC-2 type transport system permease protein